MTSAPFQLDMLIEDDIRFHPMLTLPSRELDKLR